MKFQLLIAAFRITILSSSCGNHIDRYQVNLDSLKTLPDNFYGYRGFVLLEDLDNNYMIQFNRNETFDSIRDINKIVNTKIEYRKDNLATTVTRFHIDTNQCKIDAQRFIELSQKYRFGHILVDKMNQISFSANEDVGVQYVMPFNDSVKRKYLADNRFKLLENGWFENQGH